MAEVEKLEIEVPDMMEPAPVFSDTYRVQAGTEWVRLTFGETWGRERPEWHQVVVLPRKTAEHMRDVLVKLLGGEGSVPGEGV